MASYCFRPHQTWTQPGWQARACAALKLWGPRLWLEEREREREWAMELRLRLVTLVRQRLSCEGHSLKGNHWAFCKKHQKKNGSLWLSPPSWQRCGSEQEELQNFASPTGLALKYGWVISVFNMCTHAGFWWKFIHVFTSCSFSVFNRHPVQTNIRCAWGSYTKFLFYLSAHLYIWI